MDVVNFESRNFDLFLIRYETAHVTTTVRRPRKRGERFVFEYICAPRAIFL